MRPRTLTVWLGLLVMLATALGGTLRAQQAPSAVFRASRDVVTIDVVVRDRSGAIVRDLTAADFEVREDGRPQELFTTSFEEVSTTMTPAPVTPLLERLGAPPLPSTARIAQAELGGRRLVLLLFDVSEMEPEEVERGVQAALKYVGSQMSSADLVAVASLSWELRLLTDFTGDRLRVRQALQSLVAVDTSVPNGPSGADADGTTAAPASAAGPVIATDARLRALRLIADALAHVAHKKALLYFTAGLGNGAQDSPAELRATTTAAARANLAIYPVDTRGLRAVIPNGPARTPSRDGEGLFSGRDVNDQFAELTASQDTLVSLATSTGGQLASGDNDLSGAFTRVLRDTAAYYLLGYSSTNTAQDGRFRRVDVRVRRPGLRVEARRGYYADRDFPRMGRAERDAQLEDALSRAPAPEHQTLTLSTGWTLSPDKTFDVALAARLDSSLISDGAGIEVRASVEDEQGQIVARVRDTVRSSGATGDTLVYTTHAQLPAGRFTVRVAARNDRNGRIGTSARTVELPASTGLAVSPALLVVNGVGAPLDGSELSEGQAHEIQFDVQLGTSSPPDATVSFFVDGIRVREARLAGRVAETLDARGTVRYRLVLPAGTLPAGVVTGQVTVVDPASEEFSLTRSTFAVVGPASAESH